MRQGLQEECISDSILYGELLWARVTDNGEETFSAQAHDGFSIVASLRPDPERKGPKGAVRFRVDVLPYGGSSATISSWHADPLKAYAKMKREAYRSFLPVFSAAEARRKPGATPRRDESGRYPHQVSQ